MGFPYSWNTNKNAGIKGPVPPSVKGSNNQFDLYGHADSEFFYAGFTESEYKSLIRSSIQRILMTMPGERVMNPKFGCDLRKYLFEPNDTSLQLDVEIAIRKALQDWEPRITVDEIKFSGDDNVLTIYVQYQILGSKIKDAISYVLKSND